MKKYYNFYITIFIVLLCFITTLISVGFSVLNQNLSVSGDIEYKQYSPLYDVLKNAANEGTYAAEYTGSHQDSMAGVGTKAIYHWKADDDTEATAILDKWNVIFGEFCWQMIRTTDTGGVKLVYNGVPSSGQCNNSGANQQIGTSKFNIEYKSPAYAGYMYNPNTLITWIGNASPTSGSLWGRGVSYSGGNYTLTSTSTDGSGIRYYNCNNTTGKCSKVRYYYAASNYTEISGGRNIGQCLTDMLSADNVNQTDSTIKTTIDNWYQNNMTSYTDQIEDTIFCNNRSITNLGGWNPNVMQDGSYLEFNTDSLNCTSDIDKFSISNNKAKLTYPVGLANKKEMDLLSYSNGNNLLKKTGQIYWLITPYSFRGNYIRYQGIDSSGDNTTINSVGTSCGVRPAISLKPETEYVDGTGSKNDPYVIE